MPKSSAFPDSLSHLFIRLMFAARALALSRFTVRRPPAHHPHSPHVLMCVDCLSDQAGDGDYMRHKPGCKTGAVLGALAALESAGPLIRQAAADYVQQQQDDDEGRIAGTPEHATGGQAHDPGCVGQGPRSDCDYCAAGDAYRASLDEAACKAGALGGEVVAIESGAANMRRGPVTYGEIRAFERVADDVLIHSESTNIAADLHDASSPTPRDASKGAAIAGQGLTVGRGDSGRADHDAAAATRQLIAWPAVAWPAPCDQPGGALRFDHNAQGYKGRDYGEPWHIDAADPAAVHSRDCLEVFHAGAAEIREQDEVRFARRVAACMNLCTGAPTEVLETAFEQLAAQFPRWILVGISAEHITPEKLDDLREHIDESITRGA